MRMPFVDGDMEVRGSSSSVACRTAAQGTL